MATSTNLAPRGGYEKSDASPRGLLYFALVMASILAATFLSLILVFKYFQKAQNPGSVVAAPFAATQPLPPPPRIQPNPGIDMQGYYQSQQNILGTYGWIDRQSGVVRLPIDRAMDLLLQRGLPTRAAAPAQNAAQTPPKSQKKNAAAASSAEPGGSAP
jgi:hypothetical protein